MVVDRTVDLFTTGSANRNTKGVEKSHIFARIGGLNAKWQATSKAALQCGEGDNWFWRVKTTIKMDVYDYWQFHAQLPRGGRPFYWHIRFDETMTFDVQVNPNPSTNPTTQPVTE